MPNIYSLILMYYISLNTRMEYCLQNCCINYFLKQIICIFTWFSVVTLFFLKLKYLKNLNFLLSIETSIVSSTEKSGFIMGC